MFVIDILWNVSIEINRCLIQTTKCINQMTLLPSANYIWLFHTIHLILYILQCLLLKLLEVWYVWTPFNTNFTHFKNVCCDTNGWSLTTISIINSYPYLVYMEHIYHTGIESLDHVYPIFPASGHNFRKCYDLISHNANTGLSSFGVLCYPAVKCPRF